MMVEGTFIIQNKLGLHARAASQLAQLAMNFDAEIMLYQGDKSAQADSVLALLLLESGKGKEVRVHCEGPDADAALAAIGALIAEKFHEQE
ncbi:HPr family phosphocarrier protein [Pseudoalteromonas ruthenica]|uniref:Phosphate ABC transporter permease n=1 Tax=Pseudoalteromonas ruthenica TaxID=151081 RepID=A0A0F4PRD1_9GAMM|nr:HPr family phosphocarrier protein [Pseudoalteromonas ruthenica]KJY97689.1 phosphate ABC transporter permease [Pseudoalteromonas ruthenica]KJZ01716.1 phosphate ABC transporter permease [Pseudoalteromonas ruthenica]